MDKLELAREYAQLWSEYKSLREQMEEDHKNLRLDIIQTMRVGC